MHSLWYAPLLPTKQQGNDVTTSIWSIVTTNQTVEGNARPRVDARAIAGYHLLPNRICGRLPSRIWLYKDRYL